MTDSSPLELTRSNSTVGYTSVSLIVEVWTVLAPSVALLGLLSVTSTVSSDSTNPSSTTVMTMSCCVTPGLNVNGEAAIVKSSGLTAVPPVTAKSTVTVCVVD